MPGSKQISEHKFGIEDIADHAVKEKFHENFMKNY